MAFMHMFGRGRSAATHIFMIAQRHLVLSMYRCDGIEYWTVVALKFSQRNLFYML
jgi:hypothetical protein